MPKKAEVEEVRVPTEQENLEKVKGEMEPLLAAASLELRSAIEAFNHAWASVNAKLTEANALARHFNRTTARHWLLPEDLRVDIDERVRPLIHHAAVVPALEPIQGQRVRLSQAIKLRDFPVGAECTLPAGEVRKLAQSTPPACSVVYEEAAQKAS